MLELDMRFEKGVLVVDLNGVLNYETSYKIKKHLTNLIKDNGIKYVLLNFDNIEFIDKAGIYSIIENYKEVAKNNGKMFLCGINRVLKHTDNLYDNLYQITEEEGAFSLLGV